MVDEKLRIRSIFEDVLEVREVLDGLFLGSVSAVGQFLGKVFLFSVFHFSHPELEDSFSGLVLDEAGVLFSFGGSDASSEEVVDVN